ncbi:hypothetical protein COOONC_25222 [Cooperia oncophora]
MPRFGTILMMPGITHGDHKMFQEVMEGIGFLTVLSGSMFIGSYFAGSVPMMFSMSESRMRMVSIFGAGLLLGTALSVIIPEGVESLYTAHTEKPHPEFSGINNPAKAKAILEDTKHEKVEPPRIIPKDVKVKIAENGLGNPKVRRKRDTSSKADFLSPLDETSVIRRKRDNGWSFLLLCWRKPFTKPRFLLIFIDCMIFNTTVQDGLDGWAITLNISI